MYECGIEPTDLIVNSHTQERLITDWYRKHCCRRSRSHTATTPLPCVRSMRDTRVGLHAASVTLYRWYGVHMMEDSRTSSLQIRALQSPTVRKFFKKEGLHSTLYTGSSCAMYCNKHAKVISFHFRHCYYV